MSDRIRPPRPDRDPFQRSPRMPMVRGVHDELIAVAEVDVPVRRYREAGAGLTCRRDRLGARPPLEFLAVPVLVDWIADRFAGWPRHPHGPVAGDVQTRAAGPSPWGGADRAAADRPPDSGCGDRRSGRGSHRRGDASGPVGGGGRPAIAAVNGRGPVG
ncbi:hypothetical protein AB0L57_24470 [Nocardia sp. NPDC052254]|uniref:hypothetical protein n=1 Tax=Nocardia sp. NPDC052254 TaxID=3155681 RepID=UPI003435C60E